MPTINIDLFDDSPKLGDKVKVMGKVKNINEDTGDVEISYDDVSIVKKKKRSDRSDDNDDDDVEMVMEEEMMPETQTLDSALGRAFPNTQ